MALWLSFILLFSYSVHHLEATMFTVKNNCIQTIYAGILAGPGPQLMNGGFELAPNAASQPLDPPAGWSGRLWGRTGCKFDPSGKGSCATGDCGRALQCNGVGGATPTSLVEITLDSIKDTYDISLVDGFNIPISVTPTNGTGDCSQIKCDFDTNKLCPQELKQESGGAVVGCNSACAAFNKPEYCCTGYYKERGNCKPTNYSQIFKSACPQAYSYAHDDQSSTFTCSGANYAITFC